MPILIENSPMHFSAELQQKRLRWIAFFWTVLLAGCVSTTPQIADPPAADISLSTVRTSAEQYLGSEVRWGGVIASVDNRRDETQLEIVARELGRDGRPRNLDQSDGRFYAVVPEFLDPSIYQEGRDVTVYGTLGRSMERAIGGFPYTYARVHVLQMHLWQPLPQYGPYNYPYPYWGYDPLYAPWYGPVYGPRYGPWGSYPWMYPRLNYR